VASFSILLPSLCALSHDERVIAFLLTAFATGFIIVYVVPQAGLTVAGGADARGVPQPSVLRLRVLTFLSFAPNFLRLTRTTVAVQYSC
jgi:hypothetical protein